MSGNAERVKQTRFVFVDCDCNPLDSNAFYAIYDRRDEVVGAINTSKYLTSTRRIDKVHPFGNFETWTLRTEALQMLFDRVRYFRCWNCKATHYPNSEKGQLLVYYMVEYLGQVLRGELTSVWVDFP